jgi:hypothetical protein
MIAPIRDVEVGCCVFLDVDYRRALVEGAGSP